MATTTISGQWKLNAISRLPAYTIEQASELTKIGEYLVPGSPDKVDSLFGALESYFPSWIDDPETLDTLYVLRSGEKLVPTAMRSVLNRDRRWLAAAPLIAKLYGVKWEKLYKLTALEYNPIENYSMTEEETPNLTTTRTPNITRTDTGTVKNGGTVANDVDLNVYGAGDSNGNVYGFNSNSPVGATQTDAATHQRTVGKADSNRSTEDRTQTNDLKHTETGTEKTEQTGNRTLKRSGNIGVTTSQQMAESEIALWQWNFYSQVFEDLDKLLTVPIY